MIPPTPVDLTLISATPGTVIFEFTGAVGVDHYDVYRSLSPDEIGTVINVAPVPQPGMAPYLVQFQDDGVFSTSAPDGPATYVYRVVAVDIGGEISLPSDALEVPVTVNQTPDLTPQQMNIVQVELRGN